MPILRLLICFIGMSPIASISLSAFHVLPLHISGPCLVLPALLAACVISLRARLLHKDILMGLVSGIVAVSIYDMSRLPFVFTSLWPDFIPKIGAYLLNENVSELTTHHVILSYIWRYIGNGGGMGLSFCIMTPYFPKCWDLRWAGTVYGLLIFYCLLATIYLSPSGRVYLFNPTLPTAMLGMFGHIIFGFILGTMARKWPCHIAIS